MRIGDNEADVGGDGPDVGDMVVDSLQLEQNRAYDQGGRRHIDSGRSFDRLTEGGGVGETGIPGNALGQEDGLVNRQVFKELLGSFVRIEHSKL